MKTRGRAVVATALIAVALLGAPGLASADGPPAPPVGMASGILVELGTGKILWAIHDQTPRPPASLTKMLTALIVLERLKLTDTAVITREARYADGNRIYAEEGWTFTVEDLLWGLLLHSGNDAAVALAQRASPDGTIGGFAALMNARAAQLGAANSAFRNPHGLDEPGHAASARDLALIATAAMRNKVFAKMVAAKTHNIKWGDGNPHTLININKLLSRYPGTVGIKTAYTTEAGRGLASAVRRDTGTLMAVVLDSPDQYKDSIALYDWGFANLPALSANPIGVIRPVTRNQSEQNPATEGLEVIQYDPASNTPGEKESAPLVAPILALTGAIVIGQLIRKRSSPKHSFEPPQAAFVSRALTEPE